MKFLAFIVSSILLITVTVLAVVPQKYVLPTSLQLLEGSRSVMLTEVGTKEATGRNDGKKIAKYLNSVSIHVPAPYCAAFVYYCFDEATLDNSLIPINKTAVANQIFSYAMKKGKPVKYAASVDDLIVWKYSNSWSGHIERIYEIHRAGWVMTVGANTGNGLTGSQRDGNGVFKRRRNILHPLGRMNIRGLIGFNTEDNNELR